MSASYSIGVRVEPNVVHFAIVNNDGDALEVNAIDKIIFPAALELPDALHHTRSMFVDVLALYDVAFAGIRTVENNAQNINRHRIGVEAVLQEAISGSPVRRFFAGPLASIAKHLGTHTAQSLKQEVDSEEGSFAIDGWSNLTISQREALLAAIAAARSFT